jgi:hypothetical protein
MLLAWIEAFLSNRSFKVKVGNVYSGKCPVVSGVPQGTVSGESSLILQKDIDTLSDWSKK